MREGWLIIGHGSRDPEGIEEFLALVRGLAARTPDRSTAVGFLEFARPTIDEAIEELAAASIERIVCLPGMLFAAGHVKNDVPSELGAAMRRWPRISFRMARALDVHAKLLELSMLRWQESLADRPPLAPEETMLLVVGRGSNDPDANSDVAKVTRLLAEAYGVGWAGTAFSGVTTPLVPAALQAATRIGFHRIVVQPYFLFTGVLVKKIHRWAEEHARLHPELDLVVTDHLGVHPLLVDVFEERGWEAVHGSPNMNCQLCQYRIKIVGHEHALGMPQSGHHHHVRGIEGGYHALHAHPHTHSDGGHDGMDDWHRAHGGVLHQHGHPQTGEHVHSQSPVPAAIPPGAGGGDTASSARRFEPEPSSGPHAWDERLVEVLSF